VTTTADLEGLLAEVNDATTELRAAPTVPPAVEALVDSLARRLRADAPLRLAADPYLTTMLFAAALRAEKALRHDSSEQQRRHLRVALEQFRHALRDIVANRPFDADAPVRDVLSRTVTTVSVPQHDIAELLGVSTRQLQRWLAPDGPAPAGDDEARVRVVGQLVNQLRHTFTGPGTLTWFYRRHPVLGVKPIALLDDPMRYPELVSAATASRAMTG
jgi:hypothetical protein